jgi:hypothetical protein
MLQAASRDHVGNPSVEGIITLIWIVKNCFMKRGQIQLFQDRAQWRTLVYMAMNFWIS